MDYFHLPITSNTDLHISRNSSFENLVSQLQKFSTKVLCVVDNCILKYFDVHTIPTYFHNKLRYDYKSTKNGITEYYFRSLDNKTLYCFFNYSYAKLAYPRLDDFISSTSTSLTSSTSFSSSSFSSVSDSSKRDIDKSFETITITDLNISEGKNTYYFHNYNYPIVSDRRTFL